MTAMSASLDHPQKHPISAEEFLRMGEAGVFAPDARLELIEGEIFEMAPIHPPHAGRVNQLAARKDFYTSAHPKPADVLLVVEVSDSTVAFDLERKVPLYARAGIRETWVVDIPGRLVHVFRTPAKGEYRVAIAVEPGDSVACEALPMVTVEVAELFPD